MSKLTVEIEYDRAAFADHKSTQCKVSLKREDGSLVWEANYNQLHFSQPLQVVGTALNDMYGTHGVVL